MLEINTLDEFKAFLKDNPKVAVDFTAQWCGPCKRIGPKFVEFSTEIKGVQFIKVDVDANPETAAEEGISAMPTFKFYKDGVKVDDFVGASEEKLKEKLATLAAM